MKNLNTRTVLRMTLIKDLNMDDEFLEGYAKLIKKADLLVSVFDNS